MVIRSLAVTITFILMVLSLVLIGNFARLLYLLPFALPMGLLIALMWRSTPDAKRHQLWNQFTSSWPFPRSLLVVSVWTLLLTLLPIFIVGHFPLPSVHDEFSYLLGAETFAQGRLTNPSPPGWEHFESFHITTSPTYQTKYQPGMSLMLAFGIWLTGQAYVGVIIAFLLGSNALAWMLHLWLPRRWALPMSLLGVVIMFGVWGNTYFVAGPLSTFASAIQLALLRRWSRADHYSIRWIDGCLWGISLVVLAWTRPFEGLLFSILTGVAALWLMVRQRQLGSWLVHLIPGLLLILLPAGWFQAEYNRALTGSRATFPYFVHDQQYFISPPFLFQPLLREPTYRHEIIKRFHHDMADWHQQFRKPSMLLSIVSFRFGIVWIHYGLFLWLIPMIVLPELWARSDTRWLFILGSIFLLLIQVVTWFLPHYAAPAWPAWWIVIAHSLRIFRQWTWQGKPVGSFVVCFFIASTCCFVALEKMVIPAMFDNEWMKKKIQIAEHLLTQAPRHLVLVQYADDHNTGQEWVYNSADIPNQPVIWARLMDDQHNCTLIGLYPNRTIWLLKVNSPEANKPYELLPYKP